MTRRGKLEGGEGWSLARACPKCGETGGSCRCGAGGGPASAGGARGSRKGGGPRPIARLRLEKRAGRAVTVAAFEGASEAAVRALFAELRTAFATGGTRRDDGLELQGEHREKLRERLRSLGYDVRG